MLQGLQTRRQLWRSDIQPAHHAAYALALLSQRQQGQRLFLAGARLHCQRAVETERLQQRPQPGRIEILPKHTHPLVDPRVVLRVVAPVVLVSVDAQHGIPLPHPRNRYCSIDAGCISIE